MKTYYVLEGPQDENVAIPHGFSFGAFLFTFFWAYAVRLWWHGIALSIVEPSFAFMFDVVGRPIGQILQGPVEDQASADPLPGIILFAYFLALHFWVGTQGNKWQRKRLVRRGYRLLKDGVAARSAEDAIAIVKPSVLLEHPLMKKAEELRSQGALDQAQLILERVVRDNRGSMLERAAEEELRAIQARQT